MNEKNRLLSVENLTISFTNAKNSTVQNVTFSIPYGKTLVLVGESGSGKTLIANALARLLDDIYIQGEIILDGKSMLKLSASDLIKIRKTEIAYIFQEPGISLNPSLTIGYQLREIINGNKKIEQAVSMLTRVGFRDISRVLKSYPHELSGGMQQRVMIAMALVNCPKLLIADEPTTALDVILQKQILELVKDLQKDFGFSMLLITHDFSLLQNLADEVCVLKDGVIIERGTPDKILNEPKNSYTQLLVQSIFSLPNAQSKAGSLPGR